MGSTPQPRRGNTRQRIQDVALELFAEQGYEKTSLREISERLDVTKAALYYHFKTKEDILIGVFEDLNRPLEELIAWGEKQPRTLETKKEILRRYSEALKDAAPLFRFVQENQASVRELSIGRTVKERVMGLIDLFMDPGTSLADQTRCFTALLAMHSGMFALKDAEGSIEEKHAAVLEVAFELITRAHTPEPEPGK
ncbi:MULTISPECIES: TetR/AcrR family transcriptional regulator [unclassified Streptomyces]|uniref:TetR/AcrR family transcriptional regulator n=1 Tax=unclassified Streptomyces TaxID=2593676 RepID=UPI0011E88D6D|nr:TetR/AcrR family transcriptional regulator [Streptomyces sp. sk2.1]TXS65394.1 TetR/AcrR family transcriptional regulator [Streptomyces sp. sk2.1]